MQTNRNSTRRSLLVSATALILSIAMLVGTTFAWFTDSASTGVNKIQAGNLDIDVMYANTPDGTYTSIENVDDLFVAPNGATKGLWEPGHTEVAYLKVVNNGTLYLKYQFRVDAASEVIGKSVLGNDIKLSEILKFAATDPTDAVPAEYTRASAQAAAEASGSNLLGYTTSTKTLAPGDSQYITLVVYMPETTGNEANYRGNAVPTINFKLTALATQVEAESDSFGDDYDEDAWDDALLVTTAEDLKAAIAAGNEEIMLANHIALNEALEIPAGTTLSLNLNGKTLENEEGYAFESKGNLTISGEGTIAGKGGIRATAGTLTINGGNYYGDSDWNHGTYQHAIKAENANVVINGGNFDATVNGQTNAMLNACENATITINGGNFKNVKGDLTQFAPYIATYEKNGKIVINNGTFYGGWRFNGETATTDIYGGNFTVGFDGQSFHANSTHRVTVSGGTFVAAANAKLTDKVKNNEVIAKGYKAVESSGAWTVVPEDAIVNSQAAFDAAIARGKTNIYLAAGNYTMVNTNYDVTISGTSDAILTLPRGVTGNSNTITFDGITVVGITTVNSDGKADWYTTQLNGATKAVYRNCTIKGLITGYCDSDFINCVFENNFTDEYSVYCYSGSTYNFTDCTFNTDCSKAIKVYDEGSSAANGRTVNVTNCKFVASGFDKAAVEIDSTRNGKYVVNITNCEINEFYSKLWNDKGTNSVVTVDGVTAVATA